VNYKTLAETIYRKWAGGDPSADSGFEIADFEQAVLQARAYKVKMDYFETYHREGERLVNPSWLKKYENVEVKYNEETDSYYSELPSPVLDLPHGTGLFFISPMKNFQEPFMAQTIGESFMFMRNPQDYITYHFDDTNVYYDNFNTEIEKVYMQIVPLIDEDIPDEFAAEVSDLVINQFLKLKQVNVLEDKVNNNNPNITEVRNG
jgi:hypothetical protein